MEKRSDMKKQEKQQKKEKLKCAIGIVFCIAFFITSIQIADNSINELIMDERDKHALGLKLYENNLEIEIAGEKHEINIKSIRDGISKADRYVKIYYLKLKDYVYSKI